MQRQIPVHPWVAQLERQRQALLQAPPQAVVLEQMREPLTALPLAQRMVPILLRVLQRALRSVLLPAQPLERPAPGSKSVLQVIP